MVICYDNDRGSHLCERPRVGASGVKQIFDTNVLVYAVTDDPRAATAYGQLAHF